MDFNKTLSCEDFLFENTSSTNQLDLDLCTKLEKESQAKSSSIKSETIKCSSPPVICCTSSTSSSISCGMMQDIFRPPKTNLQKAPNIDYELAVAKSIMQEYSTISGDNLFDHLSDIIKRVIDERPPNVIDFFEEFSRNIREQKFHLPERFPPDAVFAETRMFKAAKKQLISMKLPYPQNIFLLNMAEDDLEEERSKTEELKLELKQETLPLFHTFYNRVQHLQFFWNQCGFNISSDDIFKLACSMNRLQTHPSIMQCRFWGIINGLKSSYYVIEATLTKEECESRFLQMEREIEQNMENVKDKKVPSHIGPEVIPGAVGWENYPKDELLKMLPSALPVPLIKDKEVFDIPPEPIGKGLNRYSYFVVNYLSDEWIELPIVTPKQISISRQIKKFFTGDLESDIISYPCFNGKEKHYLRAMIARITAGTYIAPSGYYRKMTMKERHSFQSQIEYETEEEEEEEEEEEVESLINTAEEKREKEPDNDVVLLKNETYDSSILLSTLNNSDKWLHVRPNILFQGRVVWYNEEEAQRKSEKEHKRFERLRLQDETDEVDFDEDEDEEDEGESEEEEFKVHAEKGPAILSPCSRDTYMETPVPWVGRFTSRFTNQNERILLMRSNVWPGAYTFIYKDLCESTYLGWGHKYVSRNMAWNHMPPISEEYQHTITDFIETSDPSVEMEDAYQLSLLKKELKFAQVDNYENMVQESTEDTEDDDDDDDDSDDDDDDKEDAEDKWDEQLNLTFP